MPNILINPESGFLEFNTGSASGSTFDTSLSGAARLKFQNSGELNLTSLGTGVADKFTVDGSNGRLLTVNNTVTGSIFSVNDVAGLPIVEVFSDDRVVMGQYATDALVVSGSDVTFANIPTVSGNPFITGFTEGDTLQTVTDRGATTTNLLSLNNGVSVTDSIHPVTINRTDGNPALISLNTQGTLRSYLGANSTDALNVWNATPTRLLTVLDGGNVGIGVADPDATLEIKSTGTSINTEAFRVRNANNSELLRVDDNGIVVVSNNYFYASSSAGAYVEHDLRVRGSLLNDQGTLAINGDVNFDSDTLYVDSTNNRVGIGTTSLIKELQVNGSVLTKNNGGYLSYDFQGNIATILNLTTANELSIGQASHVDSMSFNVGGTDDAIFINSSANVGIGTINPTASLDVVGNARIKGSSSDGVLTMENAAGSQSLRIDQNSLRTNTSNNLTLFTSGNSTQLVLHQGGNVGIGTNNPAGTTTIHSALDCSSDFNTHNKYALNLHNLANDTNESIGISFGLSSDATAVGAAIAHERKGPSSYGDLYFLTRPSGGNVTERMRITSAGNVGIGKNNPSYKLEIDGGDFLVSTANGGYVQVDESDNSLKLSDNIRLKLGTSNDIQIYSDNANLYYDHNNYDVYFRSLTNDKDIIFETRTSDSQVEIMRFDGSTSRVGIGTNSPVSKVHIENTAYDLDSSPAVGDFHLMLRDLDSSTSGDAISIGFAQTTDANTVGAKLSFLTEASHSRGSLVFSTNSTADTGDNTAERLRITSAGNVGIGRTDPQTKLDVNGTFRSVGIAYLNSDVQVGGDQIIFTNDAASAYIQAADALYIESDYDNDDSNNKPIVFKCSASERMIIQGDGKVGIGTTSPDTLLHLEASDPVLKIRDTSDATNSATLWLQESDNFGAKLHYNSNSNNFFTIGIIDGGTETERFAIDRYGDVKIDTDTLYVDVSEGNVGIGTNSPLGKLEVNSSTVIGSVNAGADDFIIQNSGYAGMSIMAASNSAGQILFGDENANVEGKIQYFHSDDSFRFSTNQNEAVRITSGGNVGIGTTNPSKSLHVSGDDANGELIKLEGDASYGATIQYGRSINYLWRAGVGGGSSTNSKIPTSYWGIEDVTSSDTPSIVCRPINQYVGVKNTNPQYELDVSGTIHGTSGNFENGITINGNPVMTGASDLDTDTLQTVTDRGNITTNDIGAGTITGNTLVITGANSTFKAFEQANDDFRIGTDTADDISIITNGSRRLTVTDAGNVGIGTTDPTAQYDKTIHIEGANPTFRAETNASAGWAYNQYVSPETTWSVGIDHNDKYIIANSATLNSNIKFVIDDANGNVGIGTTAPEQPFHLAATNYKPALIQRTAGTNCYLLLEDQNTTQDVGVGATTNDLKFRAGNVDYMALNSVGVLNVGTEAVTDTKLFVTGARSDSLARFKDGSDGVEITTRGVSRQQIDFLGSNTSAINAKGSLHINYDSDNNGSNDSIHFTRNGADEAGTVDMVIKEGNVGIGVGDPDAMLQIGDGSSEATLFHSYDQYNEVKFYGFSDTTDSGVWQFINDGTWDQTRFFIQDANNSSSRLTLHVKGNNGATEILAATSAGNVGIGTTNPAELLHVEGSNATVNVVENGAATVKLRAGSVGRVGTYSNHDFSIVSNSTDQVRIKSDGNVGIGTTNPQVKLDLRGDMRLDSAGNTDRSIYFRNQATAGKVRSDASLQFDVGVSDSPSVAMYIEEDTRNVGILTTDPQSRLDVSLGAGATSPTMNSTGVNNLLTLRVGNNEDPANVANAGAKWGMRLRGFVNDNSSPNRKTAAVYAVSEDVGAGYNRRVGMALHTSPFDSDHVERVRIDAEGLVGIGTNDPRSRLHVYEDAVNNASNADYGIAAFENVNKEGLSIGYDADDNYTYLYSREVGVASRSLRLNGSIYVENYDGNVGIGTTDPDKTLQVGGQVRIDGSTTDGLTITSNAGASRGLELYNNSSTDTAKIINYYNGPLILGQSNADVLTIDNDSVGINVAAPAGDKLMVQAENNYFAARLDGSTTAGQSRGLRVRAGYNSSDFPVLIEKGDGTDIFIIDGLGNVGIGSAPSYELDVAGTTRSTYYIGGAYLEENASSSKLKFYKDGTVLVIDGDGELKPCDKENDTLVFGVSKIDFDSPVVLGAEPILVTGPIKVGDYIVTSSKQGHGQAMKEQNLGTIIAQAMENGDGESYNIKAMIRKM